MPKTTQKCSEGNIGTSVQFLYDNDLCEEMPDAFRTRAYVFTSFQEKPPNFNGDMKYLLYAPELCPTTGRKHFQGYVYWHSAKTISASSKALGKITVKVAKGDIDKQLSYIRGPYEKNEKTKPYNPEWKEFGKRPEQGERIDLQQIKNEIINGKSVDEITMENPLIYHQYGRTLNKIQNIALRKKYRKWMTEGFWYIGKTGIGKSHIAFEGYDPSTHYIFNLNDNGFWNGYTGQEIVIIQELRGQIPFGELLDIIDKWPKTVKIKGEEPVPLLAKKVIITSPKHPKEVYLNVCDDDDRIEQLLRRIKIIELLEAWDNIIPTWLFK